MLDIKNFSFSKKNRLLKRKDFLALQEGQVIKIRGNFFLVLIKENSLHINRLGIIVKKKVGSAVVRNYYKRLVREFFRFNKNNWPQGYDFIFIAQQNKNKTLKNYKEEEFKILHNLIIKNLNK